jgi:hypothetical protein
MKFACVFQCVVRLFRGWQRFFLVYLSFLTLPLNPRVQRATPIAGGLTRLLALCHCAERYRASSCSRCVV